MKWAFSDLKGHPEFFSRLKYGRVSKSGFTRTRVSLSSLRTQVKPIDKIPPMCLIIIGYPIPKI
jgi:hypothetical protein